MGVKKKRTTKRVLGGRVDGGLVAMAAIGACGLWIGVGDFDRGRGASWNEAQAQTDPPPPPALGTVPIPEPSNLADFVKDKAKAIALGKALFWDTQVGSDGKQSCASCHFNAGADSRAKNQLSPGLLRIHADTTANPDKVSSKGMNHTLTAADFPFRKLTNANDRNSTVVSDTNDVAASQGVAYREFVSVQPGSDVDNVTYAADPDGFQVANVNVRRVEPRNTPTVINAVFNQRQFWDGRAQATFNGVNIWGTRDPDAKLFRADSTTAAPVAVTVAIDNASLASQAVGPPLSSFEMSADARTFLEIGDKFSSPTHKSTGKGKKLPRRLGRKLAALRPLGDQLVHPDDSVLGALSRSPLRGLTKDNYAIMVSEAFQNKWWDSPYRIKIAADGSRSICSNCAADPEAYSLTEYNFSLFFGLAIQLYEATLVSADTPYDRYAAGETAALTDAQKRGLGLFLSQTRGRCINCHAGAELTNASVNAINAKRFRWREGNVMDMGFNNIGVRPVLEDLGLGGKDGTNAALPLSEARLKVMGLFTDPTNVQPPPDSSSVLGVDGAFKVPGLRNVELTAPYFHNGGQLTLRQVIEFYGRGGDFVPIHNLAGQTISPLSTPVFTEQEKDDLVAFLLALTDERVRYRRAPFDHPEIAIPNGHPGTTTSVTNDGTGTATDGTTTIPAVGRLGAAQPLPAFPAPLP